MAHDWIRPARTETLDETGARLEGSQLAKALVLGGNCPLIPLDGSFCTGPPTPFSLCCLGYLSSDSSFVSFIIKC